MLKLINNLRKLKLMSQEDIDKTIDEALTKFRNTHNLRSNDNENIKSLTEEDPYYILNENEAGKPRTLFSKVKNESIKEILNSAFTYLPDEKIQYEDLVLLQSAIRSKYNTDPIWQGAVDSFRDYVVGSGSTVSTPVDEINSEINSFRKRNKMPLRERNCTSDLFQDGEYFFLLWTDPKTNNVYLRKVEPRSITEIETDSLDIEAKFSYLRSLTEYDERGQLSSLDTRTQRVLDINYKTYQEMGLNYGTSKFIKEAKKNVVCKHIKLSEETELRGRPPGRALLKFLQLYANFLLDRLTLNHERSKVVWIKSVKGRSNDDIKSSIAPKGGIMLVESENVQYRIESSKLEASEAKEDALHALYYIASGIRYPLHILNQRTDQQVYSSIRKADTPFSTMISSFQSFISIEFEDIYRYQIMKKVEKGVLQKSYKYPSYSEDALFNSILRIEEMKMNGATETQIFNDIKPILKDGLTQVEKPTQEIPINIEFPQIIWQDPKEVAEVLKTHIDAKIVSRSTASAKAGYDGRKELAKILKETELGFDLKPGQQTQESPEKKTVKPTEKKTVKPTEKK